MLQLHIYSSSSYLHINRLISAHQSLQQFLRKSHRRWRPSSSAFFHGGNRAALLLDNSHTHTHERPGRQRQRPPEISLLLLRWKIYTVISSAILSPSLTRDCFKAIASVFPLFWCLPPQLPETARACGRIYPNIRPSSLPSLLISLPASNPYKWLRAGQPVSSRLASQGR